jgi:ceramide glucosyltransferase
MTGIATVLTFGCAAFWVAAIATRIGSVAAAFLQPALARRLARREDRPPLSVLVPVKRHDPGLDEAFASLLRQRYPSFEVVVAAERDDLPALRVAREVVARFPGATCRFLVGNDGSAVSPKLNNLAPALAHAKNELILVKDANVLLDEDQLSGFVRHLTPGVGLVCAVPVAERPAGLAAEIECAMINGHAAPLLLAASALGFGFGYGKIMLFDRRNFVQAGGIDAISTSVGEDHALSKALARLGLRTAFAADVVRQVAGDKSFSDVWNRQLRWMVVRRQEEPAAFYAEVFFSGAFTTFVGAVGARAAGVPWWAAAGATVLIWMGAEGALLLGKGWEVRWRFPLAAICRELMIPALWLRTWTARKVVWGDALIDVRRHGAR